MLLFKKFDSTFVDKEELVTIWNQGCSDECNIREIKIHVYGKPLTSDSSWEFLKIENKKIKTVQNNSYG